MATPCAPYHTLEILQLTAPVSFKPCLYTLQECWALYRRVQQNVHGNVNAALSEEPEIRLDDVKDTLQLCAQAIGKLKDTEGGEKEIERLVMDIKVDLESFVDLQLQQEQLREQKEKQSFVRRLFGGRQEERGEHIEKDENAVEDLWRLKTRVNALLVP
ncbi:hypothetical protein BT69DRAFT_1328343 [Atractiella rhizophila]|nr:hypothetical protein BT69DRAFT_1328343 [Atractiella rhizophila]